MSPLARTIEALLFLSSEPVAPEALIEAAECSAGVSGSVERNSSASTMRSSAPASGGYASGLAPFPFIPLTLIPRAPPRAPRSVTPAA